MKLLVKLCVIFLAGTAFLPVRINAMEKAFADSGNQHTVVDGREKENPSAEKKDVDECPICIDEIKIGAKATINPCKHSFHVHCIGRLLVSNANAICPLCRGKIASVSTLCLDKYATKTNKKEIKSLNLFLANKWSYTDQFHNVFDKDRAPEAENVTADQERNSKFKRHMVRLAKLLPQEFVAGLLNGLIARTLLESDFSSDLPGKTGGGLGIMVLLAGSNGLLHLINPQRTNHLGKVATCWAAGLALGGFYIPNQLKKYIEKVKAESCLR